MKSLQLFVQAVITLHWEKYTNLAKADILSWFESDAFSSVLEAGMPISVSPQWQCGVRANQSQVFQSTAPTGVTLRCHLPVRMGLSGAV